VTGRIARDAQNRAWRTLLQGLMFDVTAAGVLVLFTAISRAESWGDLEWQLLSWTFFKSVVVAGLSYLMRRVFTKQMPPVGP
jgi:uncharacterized membrane protein (DUF2068 family)